MSTETKVIVAAIDFGTTYSGLAYAFRNDYKTDPRKVHAFTNWADGRYMQTSKTPTVVLFNPAGEFHSFGFEAEAHYANLASKNEHHGWRYFKRFKMKLLTSGRRKIDLGMQLEDDQGHKMPAIDVFAAAIRYFYTYLMQALSDRGLHEHLQERDTHWVLTVPAIWGDHAKEFMVKAADEAGIPESRLMLAYEPEAAAVCCKEDILAGLIGNDQEAFKPGAKFIVVDLGGGTVDITSHEINPEGNLDTLHAPTGGPFGGTLVDDGIFKLLAEICGKPIFNNFFCNIDCKTDKLDLEREIEQRKRILKPSVADGELVSFKIPYGLVDRFNAAKTTLEKTIHDGKFRGCVSTKRGNLQIQKGEFDKIFKGVTTHIVKEVQSVMSKKELENVSVMIMVGGFSESEFVRTAVKHAFPKCRIIIPEEGSVAIVKGAVMFGFNSKLVTSRILPLTYGITTSVPFEEGKHSAIHRFRYPDGEVRCMDLFQAFVRKGDTLKSGETTIEHKFPVPSLSTTEATIEVYRSTEREVEYTSDEGCRPVGVVHLKLTPCVRETKAEIRVFMRFGDTRITVTAREEGTDNKVDATFTYFGI